jgi:hypothetical protein
MFSMSIMNEVGQGVYRVKMVYVSQAYNRRHSTQVYTTTPIVSDADGAFVFNGVNDPDVVAPTPYPLSKFVRTFFNRFGDGYTGIGSKIIESVEVSIGAMGENLYLGLDGGDYTDVVGSGSTIAASHTILVFAAQNKRQFRTSVFDGGVASPNRVPRVQPPNADDGSIAWLMLKSPVTMTTRYGEVLTRISSLNTGYNRKLAIEYGRIQ